MTGKVKVLGFTDDCDIKTYGYEDEREGDINLVHVVEQTGDSEATICGLDLVHGVIGATVRSPVTCNTCLRGLRDYKKIHIGTTKKGPIYDDN